MRTTFMVGVGLFLTIFMYSVTSVQAQGCVAQATIGNFEFSFEGATYDGTVTEFSYCITGLDVQDFHALSNWLLSVDPQCISADTLVACSPEPCFYQTNDPNLSLTGIKFDDLEVEKGETSCFSFSLEGDWTKQIADVTAGVKAGQDIASGSLCGPACVRCTATLSILPPEDDSTTFRLSVSIHHNGPRTVSATIEYSILDMARTVVHAWTEGPITLAFGDHYGSIQPLPTLTPGKYMLQMQLQGMLGWVKRQTPYIVPATP